LPVVTTHPDATSNGAHFVHVTDQFRSVWLTLTGDGRLTPDPDHAPNVRRVVITGSESTGKSTLARNLATYLGATCVVEFARGYAAAKGAPLDVTDVEPIARGQITVEEEGLRTADRLLVMDTDLVSTLVYARQYYGAAPQWIEDAARVRIADLYLLCLIDVPWVADPARDRPRDREQMHEAFEATLRTLGANYVVIRGDWQERFERSLSAIKRILSAPATGET
jgi:NadR type nicotinamide-nucleotide adenylyltransferase